MSHSTEHSTHTTFNDMDLPGWTWPLCWNDFLDTPLDDVQTEQLSETCLHLLEVMLTSQD
jgi:hypothetical protein